MAGLLSLRLPGYLGCAARVWPGGQHDRTACKVPGFPPAQTATSTMLVVLGSRRPVPPQGKLHITTPAHHAVAWGTLSGTIWGR